MSVVGATRSITDKLPGADPSQNPLLCPCFTEEFPPGCALALPGETCTPPGSSLVGDWQKWSRFALWENVSSTNGSVRHKTVTLSTQACFIKQINILEFFVHLKWLMKYTGAKSCCLETKNGSPGEIPPLYDPAKEHRETLQSKKGSEFIKIQILRRKSRNKCL